MNPTGSVKDRAAKQMIEEAEHLNLLKPGCAIVEGIIFWYILFIFTVWYTASVYFYIYSKYIIL